MEGLLSVEQALARILDELPSLPSERAAVTDALGRRLAEDVLAHRTVPPWDNSAMDGYALRAADLSSWPRELAVVEEIFAGAMPTRAIGPGDCARIMTGAPVPPGADAVVMQERTTRLSPGRVRIEAGAVAGENIRRAGADSRRGELLLPAGTLLGIPEAGLLWSQPHPEVTVPRRPRVGILATGDELSAWDAPAAEGLVDTNSPTLAAAVVRAGGVAVPLGIARDTVEDVLEHLAGAAGLDVVLTSAGVSVGDKDVVGEALRRAGVELCFWKVAMKPGKPLLFGRRERTVFFGLPGNPVSSLVTFELFVRPALRRMRGHAHTGPEVLPGRAETAHKASTLTHFVRVVARWRDDAWWAAALETQSSGALRSAAGATHLLRLPPGQAVAPGDPVWLIPLSWSGERV